MTITEVSNNGRSYQFAPTLNIRVNTQLPQGAVLQVKRNDVVVGTAVQTAQLLYSFTDSVNLGANVYTVDLVLENLTLPSAPYNFTTEVVPVPVITSVTDGFLAPVTNGSEVASTDLIFNITVSPALLGDAYVDLYKNDDYVGTAVRQTDTTKFVIEVLDVGTEAQSYVAQTRVAEFSTTSAAFALTPVAAAPTTVEFLIATPLALSIEALCANETMSGTNDFILEIAISADAPTGTFTVADGTGAALTGELTSLPTAISHVQGVATVISYNTAESELSSMAGLYGTVLSLVRDSDSAIVDTTVIPQCGSEGGTPEIIIG